MNGPPILPPRKNNYSMSLKKIIQEVAEREGHVYEDYAGPDPKTLFDKANEKDRERCRAMTAENVWNEPAVAAAQKPVSARDALVDKKKPASVCRPMSTSSLRMRTRGRAPVPKYPRPTTQVSLEDAPRVGLPLPDEEEYEEEYDDDLTQEGAGSTPGNRSAPLSKERPYTDHGTTTNVLVGPVLPTPAQGAHKTGNIPVAISLLHPISQLPDAEFVLLFVNMAREFEKRCQVEGLASQVIKLAARDRI